MKAKKLVVAPTHLFISVTAYRPHLININTRNTAGGETELGTFSLNLSMYLASKTSLN
jgi:hypothetical protein